MLAETTITPLDYEEEFVLHLADQEAMEIVAREQIDDRLFLKPLTKSIYALANHHYTRTGRAPSRDVLEKEFDQYPSGQSRTEIEFVIDRLRYRFKRNEVERLSIDIAKRVKDPIEALAIARQKLDEIDTVTLEYGEVFKTGDAKHFLASLQDRVIAGQFRGVSMGFDEIDAFTGGIKKGQVAYMLARPKIGKTMNICKAWLNQIIHNERPFLYTLENSEDEIKLRLTCLISGFPYNRAKNGDFGPGDWEFLQKAWDEFDDMYGASYFLQSPADEERTVANLFKKAQKVGATSVIISQFPYIRGSKLSYRQDFAESAEVALDLKRHAGEYQVPVLVEAQFNRGGDSMTELRDFDAGKVGLTDKIPQSADILFGLFVDRELQANNMREIGIILARDCEYPVAWYLQADFKDNTDISLVPASQH